MSMNVPGGVGPDLTAAIAAAVNGDFHTLFLMVNSERVRLMDAQLIDQIGAVKARNDQIARLNDVLAKLNSFQTVISGTDAGSKPAKWTEEDIKQYEIPLNDAIRAAGIKDLGFKGNGQVTPGPGEKKDGSQGHIVKDMSNSNTTKGQLDTALAKVKGLVDAESNNQQMDMFRLQSLNNKKNEGVDLLTNGQKKYSDSVMSITRNF